MDVRDPHIGSEDVSSNNLKNLGKLYITTSRRSPEAWFIMGFYRVKHPQRPNNSGAGPLNCTASFVAKIWQDHPRTVYFNLHFPPESAIFQACV